MIKSNEERSRIVSHSCLCLAIYIPYFILNFIVYNVHSRHLFGDILFHWWFLSYLILDVKGVSDWRLDHCRFLDWLLRNVLHSGHILLAICLRNLLRNERFLRNISDNSLLLTLDLDYTSLGQLLLRGTDERIVSHSVLDGVKVRRNAAFVEAIWALCFLPRLSLHSFSVQLLTYRFELLGLRFALGPVPLAFHWSASLWHRLRAAGRRIVCVTVRRHNAHVGEVWLLLLAWAWAPATPPAVARWVNRGLHEGGVWLLAPVHRPVYEVHLWSMAPLGCRVDIVHIAQVISSELAIASFPDPRAALTVFSLTEFNHIVFVGVAEQV